jgi:hypothetical protein
LRRVIFAFAARSVSVLVGFRFGLEPFFKVPIVGIMGCAGVAMVETFCGGWVLIGPIFDSSLGITDNSSRPG